MHSTVRERIWILSLWLSYQILRKQFIVVGWGLESSPGDGNGRNRLDRGVSLPRRSLERTLLSHHSFLQESYLKFCQVQTKVVTDWWHYHHWSALIEQHIVKLCRDIALVYMRQQYCGQSDFELVTCDLNHQLTVCPKCVKEPGLVWYFFSLWVVYKQTRCDHFGHCFRMLYGW